MDEDLIAWIIGIATIVVTVGGIVWAGVHMARRSAKHQKQFEVLPEGVILHAAFSDVRLGFGEIVGLSVVEHSVDGGPYWALDVKAGDEVHEIVPDGRCSADDLRELVRAVDQRARAANPKYQPFQGNLAPLLEEIRKLTAEGPEAFQAELDARIAAREAELGRPLTDQEKLAVVMQDE
jgi:hypothetical protein